MIDVQPVTLTLNGIRLEPLGAQHADGLRAAAVDGALWRLRVTSVPEPEQVDAYIAGALAMSNRLAFAVIEEDSGAVLGSTSYHDIVSHLDRVEIGWTWYAKRVQRSHVNSSCKMLLLGHAFEHLGCQVVGLRTDNFNFASQQAIERLGARRDGVIRHHALRRDGSVRDTVMYSITRGEWPEIRAQLAYRLQHHGVPGTC
ncbi:GNAT family N-acetyltransferase [Massilia sp. PWRC2]|uniref:GNAT family N-acetyltransferase n=1 Tax=Massilia sp. PWRC2 TaxID=2804626 RepID=UPI003CEBB104